jgi:hypothetical protein
MELTIPNPEHAGRDVDVGQREPNHLTPTKACGVQKDDGEAHDLSV